MKIVTATVRGASSDAVDKEIKRILAKYESMSYDLDVKQGILSTTITVTMHDVD